MPAPNRFRELGEYPKNLRTAVNKHCRECNDSIGRWEADNDCSVWKCWLYPFRPGKGGEERVVRKKSEARSAAAKAQANNFVRDSKQESPADAPRRASSRNGKKNTP